MMFCSMFTTSDNVTGDLGRVIWAAISVCYVIFTGWVVFRTGIFDPVAWRAGLAAVNTACAAGLAIKSKTEPKP